VTSRAVAAGTTSSATTSTVPTARTAATTTSATIRLSHRSRRARRKPAAAAPPGSNARNRNARPPAASIARITEPRTAVSAICRGVTVRMRPNRKAVRSEAYEERRDTSTIPIANMAVSRTAVAASELSSARRVRTVSATAVTAPATSAPRKTPSTPPARKPTTTPGKTVWVSASATNDNRRTSTNALTGPQIRASSSNSARARCMNGALTA